MRLHPIQSVLDQLPFHIDDVDRVNEAFVRWRKEGHAGDKALVEMWTYAYIYRYFLYKLAPTPQHQPVSIDELVERAFRDVQANLNSIRNPERYASWISTVCRHTFLNHLRSRKQVQALDAAAQELATDQPAPGRGHDSEVLRHTVRSAIEGLPTFLRDIARMRLMEECSYSTMSRRTGKPLPILRSYVNKALRILRQNTQLQGLMADLTD